MENAVDYTPAQGRIDCRARSEDAGWSLTLSNTNPGLNPRELPHIFEPLWRRDAARSDRAHAGLGLPLVQALAERLGLVVEADLTESGLFRITLRNLGRDGGVERAGPENQDSRRSP
jgi:signal transduction histidine kinase